MGALGSSFNGFVEAIVDQGLSSEPLQTETLLTVHDAHHDATAHSANLLQDYMTLPSCSHCLGIRTYSSTASCMCNGLSTAVASVAKTIHDTIQGLTSTRYTPFVRNANPVSYSFINHANLVSYSFNAIPFVVFTGYLIH